MRMNCQNWQHNPEFDSYRYAENGTGERISGAVVQFTALSILLVSQAFHPLL